MVVIKEEKYAKNNKQKNHYQQKASASYLFQGKSLLNPKKYMQWVKQYQSKQK
jgi:hypothetical protein